MLAEDSEPDGGEGSVELGAQEVSHGSGDSSASIWDCHTWLLVLSEVGQENKVVSKLLC